MRNTIYMEDMRVVLLKPHCRFIGSGGASMLKRVSGCVSIDVCADEAIFLATMRKPVSRVPDSSLGDFSQCRIGTKCHEKGRQQICRKKKVWGFVY